MGEWPQPKAEAALALKWNWKSLWWPPLTALILTLAAVFIPLPERSGEGDGCQGGSAFVDNNAGEAG